MKDLIGEAIDEPKYTIGSKERLRNKTKTIAGAVVKRSDAKWYNPNTIEVDAKR